jgi:serine/threonine-protein kinase HipA
VSSLAVKLNGRRVGTITQLPGEKQFFAFEQDYLDDPGRPTLSLSYKSRNGGLVTAVRPVHRRVPAFFSNLLPEGHLRAYLAEQAGVNPEREYFLLAALGADLPGALTIAPLDHGEPDLPPDAVTERPSRRRRGPLRFSLAGVQLKFSAVLESAGGLTIPAQGIGGSWILKLPSPRFAFVAENEFTVMELARAIGIPVPKLRLAPVRSIEGLPPEAGAVDGNALAVERFDRGSGSRRIHMEDFAQVFGQFPEAKYKSASYANIARVLWAETGDTGLHEFVRRLAFSVVVGNGDMHLKNWSLLYRDGRTPALSPAYDLVSTLPYIAGDQLALTFGGSRSLEEIDADQIRRFADTAGVAMTPLVRIVRDTAEATAAAWRKLTARDLLPADLRKAIGQQIARAARNISKALA